MDDALEAHVNIRRQDFGYRPALWRSFEYVSAKTGPFTSRRCHRLGGVAGADDTKPRLHIRRQAVWLYLNSEVSHDPQHRPRPRNLPSSRGSAAHTGHLAAGWNSGPRA